MYIRLSSKFAGVALFTVPSGFLYSVWSAGGRRLLLFKQAQVSCGKTFSNPVDNRKQAPVISLIFNQCITEKVIGTPRHFLIIDLHAR